MFLVPGKRDIFGVDFSGAKDACNKIWLSQGRIKGERLQLVNCYPLSEVSSGRIAREHCFHILLDIICSNKNSIFGMDFPFGIPLPLMQGFSWNEFIRHFPEIYANEDEFRTINRRLSGNIELKRTTDRDVKAPFCVYNLRMYRQTYFGIRDIIRPLVVSDAASILPMHPIRMDVPWLMEICPASTLKKEGVYLPYKGKRTKERTSREHILDHLERNALELPNEIRMKALQNVGGDALDSIIAAYSVFNVLHTLFRQKEICEPYIYEGFTFV
ncbi:hypothetical protein [Methanomethylovorans sp.]|uniref:hypothetical protein n=1 Tax=Methanomethylovorans sp. TaxID=2758717 RepID=UPI00345E35C0